MLVCSCCLKKKKRVKRKLRVVENLISVYIRTISIGILRTLYEIHTFIADAQEVGRLEIVSIFQMRKLNLKAIWPLTWYFPSE